MPQTEQSIEVITQAITPQPPVENLPAIATGGFMSIIEKAAALENIDVDKLERMMQMQLQWEDRQAKKEFDEAKARISEKLSHIRIVKNKDVRYDKEKGKPEMGSYSAFKYATIEDIDKHVRPLLIEESMAVSYDTEASTLAGWHTIVCWLSRKGHREAYRIPMPLDTSGGKGNAQAMGSTQTYGMRRALCGALNIITVGDDDDGQGGPITDEQAIEIKDELKKSGMDVVKFLKAQKVESVEQIRTKDFNRALNAIQAFIYRTNEEKKKKGGASA